MNIILKKRTASNLVLFGCVIILTLIIRFNPLNSSAVDAHLLDIKKSDITTISILRPNKEAITLERDGHWFLTKPIHIKANQSRIENILNISNSKSISQFSSDELNLNDFALGANQVTLMLNHTQLIFGDTDPIDKQRYVLIEQTLHLIDDIVYPIITANIGSLIDTQLLLQPEDIRAFELPKFRLSKDAENSWSLNTGEPHTLSAATLSTWVSVWQQVHAIYVSHKVIPYDPEQKILITNSHDSIEFIIINRPDSKGLYRPDLELMYHLSDDILKQITTLP